MLAVAPMNHGAGAQAGEELEFEELEEEDWSPAERAELAARRSRFAALRSAETQGDREQREVASLHYLAVNALADTSQCQQPPLNPSLVRRYGQTGNRSSL